MAWKCISCFEKYVDVKVVIKPRTFFFSVLCNNKIYLEWEKPSEGEQKGLEVKKDGKREQEICKQKKGI